MARRAKAAIANPFYALLVLIGIVFVVTACAYGVMAFRAVRPPAREANNAQHHPLIKFLESHGSQLLLGEIAALAVATVAAMATDDYWIRRTNRRLMNSDPAPGNDLPPGKKPQSDD